MAVQDTLPDNLWPEIEELTRYADTPPREILQKQAKFLGQRTSNLLEAVVRSSIMDEQTGKTYHNFMVCAPLLPKVETKLFWLGQPLTLYPADVMLGNTLYRQCEDSSALRQALHALFNEQSVLRQISSLLADTNVASYVDDADDEA